MVLLSTGPRMLYYQPARPDVPTGITNFFIAFGACFTGENFMTDIVITVENVCGGDSPYGRTCYCSLAKSSCC